MFTSYTVLLTLHVVCAVLWIGGGATLHVIGRRVLASGDRKRMQDYSRDADFIGPRFYAPLSLVLLVAGMLLVDKVGGDFSDTWISLGLAGWIVSFVIGILYYPRAARRREAIVDSDGLDSDVYLAQFRQVSSVNLIELTILLLVIADMTLKPGS